MCSYELNDKEFESQLFECTLIIVSLLLKQYKENLIDINDFKSHTTNKINYIINSYNNIDDNMKKSDIERLIKECLEINNYQK